MNHTQYLENKNAFNVISGGGTKWTLFDEKEKNEITKNYNKIITSNLPCAKMPLKTLKTATSGVTLKHKRNENKNWMCYHIDMIRKNNDRPMIHDDSFAAWAVQGVEKYGLTVGDIIEMKFGETMDVILMDRNSGEAVDDQIKIGKKFKPTELGFTLGTYIHGDGLTGLMKFTDMELVHVPFQWQINLTALGDKVNAWGPINGCCGKKTKKDQINVNDLDKNILVGWRGPGIRMSDAKHLPEYVVKYGTTCDDYPVWGSG